MQAALAERTGDSAQGENKQWLLIAQHLQKKTLSWVYLSPTPSGFLLLWLPGTVPGCARPQFCPPLSLTLMLSFLFWPMSWAFTLSGHLQTLCSQLMRFPCHHSAQQIHLPFLTSFLLPLLPSTAILSLSPPLSQTSNHLQFISSDTNGIRT